MKLTDARLRTLANPEKTTKLTDGAGLYLELTPAGGRYWRLKYRHGGKEKRLALGVYPDVSLKEAREKAEAARKVLQGGVDPGELKKAAKAQQAHEAATTFKAVAGEWMKHQAGRWTERTRLIIARSLENHAFPALGDRPLASLKALEVIRAVQAIEDAGAGEMAARVLQRAQAVCRWAVVHGLIEASPVESLRPSEILKPRELTHRPALSDRDLPAFLAKLDAYPGDPTTAHALRFLVLTAVRSGEVRGARWAEIDREAALWIIPAERMKMKTEHRVPLSRQALLVLDAMERLSGERDLVFPSPSYRSKPLSENTFNSALRRMGYPDATAHGFRSLFSTVANEHDRTRGEIVERALAHQDRNKVRAAYLRSTFLSDRVGLMQWWADHLDALRKGGEVIQLHKAA